MVVEERIRELRTAKRITAAELARTVGYNSRTTISKIEHGVISPPLSKNLSFAEALNTTVAYLIGVTDDPEGSNLIGKVDNRTVNELVTVDKEEH
jgi:transcriptional regulator with XRE-family HTH domain